MIAPIKLADFVGRRLEYLSAIASQVEWKGGESLLASPAIRLKLGAGSQAMALFDNLPPKCGTFQVCALKPGGFFIFVSFSN